MKSRCMAATIIIVQLFPTMGPLGFKTMTVQLVRLSITTGLACSLTRWNRFGGRNFQLAKGSLAQIIRDLKNNQLKCMGF